MKQKVKKALIATFRCIFKWIYKKPIWVFTSWDGQLYSDNPKYLFEYIISEKKDVLPIWLVRNKLLLNELRKAGIKVIWVNRYSRLLVFCIADCFFFSDTTSPLHTKEVDDITYVNLWHGMPIKRIGHMGKNSDYIIATNPSSQEILCNATTLSLGKVLLLGQPKNDGLFTRKSLRNKLKLPINSKIITYMPTYRGTFHRSAISRDNATGIFLDESLKDNIEFNRFINILETFNAYFIIKPHIRNTFTARLHERIIVLDEFAEAVANIDNYEILGNTDILISDFSSLILDFFILDRPIIFFAPDWEDYCQTQQLNYEYSFLTQGKACTSITELIDKLQHFLTDSTISPGQEYLKIFFNSYADSNNSKRIYDFFKDINNK